MNELDLLIDAGLYYDAFNRLNQFRDENDPKYLFYLGYIQVNLGWTEEAIQTLTKCKLKEKDTELIGATSGLLADIYHNDGMLFDAVSEISTALKVDPDSPLIQKRAEEILGDFNDLFNTIIFYMIVNNSIKRILQYGK